MTTQALAAARDLYSTVDARAGASGDDPVPRSTIDDLREADLHAILCPKAVGGAELSMWDAVEVIEEISRADGSAGWCLMATAAVTAYFGAYSPASFVEVLFADGIPLAAGQFAPNGTGSMLPDGSITVTGRYAFGSGLHVAEWVGAGVVVDRGGGDPEYRLVLLPREQIVVHENWDVLGLRGTASHDYSIDRVLVPGHASFPFLTPTRFRGGRHYDLGVIPMTTTGHAGFALGIARRMLDELAAVARHKTRLGASARLCDSETFLQALGSMESRLAAARAWVRETVFAAQHAAAQADPDLTVTTNRLRQATVHATTEAAAIAHDAYLLAGTSSLRAGTLQRCFRDIHAASQHYFASPSVTIEMARDLVASGAE